MEDKLSVLIVDDEPQNLMLMSAVLDKFCPEVDRITAVKSISEAAERIASEEVDILFLDIELSGENGFELLAKSDTTDFSVIISTAYPDEYLDIIKQFKLSVLLKPVDYRELQKIIKEVQKKGKEHFAVKRSIAKAILEQFDFKS